MATFITPRPARVTQPQESHTFPQRRITVLTQTLLLPKPEPFVLSSRTAQATQESIRCLSQDGSASNSDVDLLAPYLDGLRSRLEVWFRHQDDLDEANKDCERAWTPQWPSESVSCMSFGAWSRCVRSENVLCVT